MIPATDDDAGPFGAAWRALRPARSLVRRVHHGRTAEGGLDCVGLFFLLYRMAGRPVDDLDGDYPPAEEMTRADVQQFVGRCTAGGVFAPVPGPIHADRMRGGDVLVMEGRTPGLDNHIAVHVGRGEVVMMTDRLRLLPATRCAPYARWVLRITTATSESRE